MDRNEIQLPSRKIRLNLTGKCNLKCNFCHKEGDKQTYRKVLSPSRLKFLLRAAKNHGINRVNITGGEPLLLKSDLNDYVETIKEVGIEKIGLVTNGTYICDSKDVIFSEFYKIRISLHSLNSDIYNKITNYKMLRKVMEGVTYLSHKNISIALNVVLLKGLNDSMEDLNDIIEFAESYRIEEIQFMEVLPINNFAREHYISVQDFGKKFESISNYKEQIDWGAKVYISKKGVKLVLMDCPCSGKHCDYCKKGKLSLYVTPEKIKQCMLGRSLPLGNPRDDAKLFKKAMTEFYPCLDS